MNCESWVSVRTEKAKPSPIHGLGLFAVAYIPKDELVALKSGHIIDRATLEEKKEIIQGSQLQVADDLYLAPLTKEELASSMIYFNHSCEPNLGINGQIAFVALRDIQAGEELTVDYGTIYADDFSMECSCGAESCRQHISGNDWKSIRLQQKYRGHFAQFIEEKFAEDEEVYKINGTTVTYRIQDVDEPDLCTIDGGGFKYKGHHLEGLTTNSNPGKLLHAFLHADPDRFLPIWRVETLVDETYNGGNALSEDAHYVKRDLNRSLKKYGLEAIMKRRGLAGEQGYALIRVIELDDRYK